jgi:SAM-dependent methyltransferase
MRDTEIELLAGKLRKEWKILEIGSGDGYVAEKLIAKYGLNVVATDVEPRFPQYTEVLSVSDAGKYFHESEFDAVISLHVLEHIEGVEKVLSDFRRIVKENGLMIHVVPSVFSMLFTSVTQPLSYIRAIYLFLNGYFLSKFYPARKKNILRFFRSMILTLNPVNIFWGPGHGVNNRVNCFKKWKISYWRRIFEKAGWRITEVESSELAYSMHKIFPFRLLPLRKGLARNGFSSSNMFIVRK